MDGGEHEAEESSSQRRARLLALRSAANAPAAEAPAPAPAAGSLLPDPDLAGDQASSLRPRPPQRFDYYTNPAAAYSGGATNPNWSNKRKSPPACYDPRPAPPPPAYAKPRNYGTYYPPHQHHVAPSPIWPSPMQFQTPMLRYPGNPFGAPPHWGSHFASPARGSYPNPPSFGFRHTNPIQGRNPNHITYGPRGGPYSSGRGRGQNYYSSTGSRGRGGRFSASSRNCSGWQYQRSYLKCMVDDPWMDMQPIAGNILIPMDSSSVEGGPGNYGNNYPPYQHHLTPSPIHSPPPMPRDAPGSSPWRSPMQYQDPMSGYQGAPPGAPPPWGPHFVPPGRGSYPNSPRFGFRHPNPGQGRSPMNYGPRGGPNSSYGRGRGPNNYGSPGSRGRGGRGGFGFQNHGWQDRISYFNKAMVDDPWLGLQPIVGNILIPRGDSESWLPKSLREKKEPPAQGQVKSTSGLSLAEYLDLSFNEVSNKEM